MASQLKREFNNTFSQQEQQCLTRAPQLYAHSLWRRNNTVEKKSVNGWYLTSSCFNNDQGEFKSKSQILLLEVHWVSQSPGLLPSPLWRFVLECVTGPPNTYTILLKPSLPSNTDSFQRLLFHHIRQHTCPPLNGVEQNWGRASPITEAPPRVVLVPPPPQG